MVDFESKRWGASNNKNAEPSEMNQQWEEMQRERVQWEQEARQEIASGIAKKPVSSANATQGMSMTPLVKQRWDVILTDQEKEKLLEVIEDR